MSDWRPCVCPHDCPDTCGMLARVEGGRVVSLRGDPEHPFTRGFLCAKGRAYPRRIHSPRRLLEPLRRVGAKGEGRFRPITWDQALDIIQERLEQVADRHGPQAILPYSYAGSMGLVTRHAGHAFFHKLGASRLQYTICSSTASAGFAASLGTGPASDLEQAVGSDLIIVWGSNTLVTNLHAWPFFQQARRRGARLVVVDPYRNQTASRADSHLMLKPGSDAALALGLMRLLLEQDLVDHDFIARHTLGFRRLCRRLQEYPLERVAAACGLRPGDIRELALAYGRARHPFIHLGWGPSRQRKGGMAMRTIALLPALVGALDRPQAGISRTTSGAAPLDLDSLTRPDLAPPGSRWVNMVQLGGALTGLEDPPVKLLYVYLSNPAAVAPDSSRVLAGLARDDLFTVVHEQFMTDTARFADLVLPGTSFVEETDLYRSYGHYYLQLSPRLIPPQGRARDTLSVFQELARRLGFGEDCFRAGRRELIEGLLGVDSPFLQGIDYQALAPGRPLRLKVPDNPWQAGFQTPSGKVEFYSRDWEERGLDPLPNGEIAPDPQGGPEFPLQLLTPPTRSLLNSTFNELPELRELAGPPCILIHPREARARGIASGDLVRVFNRRGEVCLQARVSRQVPPGLTVIEGIYWSEYMPGGKGVNQLTSQDTADIGGSCAFHCNAVQVEGV